MHRNAVPGHVETEESVPGPQNVSIRNGTVVPRAAVTQLQTASWAMAACRTSKALARWGAYCAPQMKRASLAFLKNFNPLSVSNFGPSAFERG